MYNYAELSSHPDLVPSPKRVPGSDSDTAPLICGLCPKGPEAREDWTESKPYCFKEGLPCEDPSTVESEGFYCFTGSKVSIHCYKSFIIYFF